MTQDGGDDATDDDERRTSAEWADVFDIAVVSPDGWDGDLARSFHEERITREEFLARVARSTTLPLRGP